MSGVHIRDIGELIVRDVQQLRQLRPVGAGLIQHDEELAVGQHGAGSVGLEQVIYVLRNTSAERTVFPHPLPKGEQEVGGVFVLEQQIDLVNENITVGKARLSVLLLLSKS